MKIQTTEGLMETAALTHTHGTLDNDHECTTWDEYWKDGKCIHRSVAITLKAPLISTTDIGAF